MRTTLIVRFVWFYSALENVIPIYPSHIVFHNDLKCMSVCIIFGFGFGLYKNFLLSALSLCSLSLCSLLNVIVELVDCKG